MRLTLRTMLAYLDNLLDPDDAKEIGRKIEESEFAKNLMHRLQDVMRRLRLAAPSAGDRGVLDPNTVAEYLDNTLPNDRVPDFEKICLESDVHLAEVGSCHQILTLVLGEPAEIDPQSRQRMYRLPEILAGEPPAAVGAEPAPATPPPIPADQQAGKRLRERPSIPDYLREPVPQGNRFLPVAGGLALVTVLALVALAASGQFEPGSRLASLFGIGGPAAEVASVPSDVPANDVRASGPVAPVETAPQPTETPAVPAAAATPSGPAVPAAESAPTPAPAAPAVSPPAPDSMTASAQNNPFGAPAVAPPTPDQARAMTPPAAVAGPGAKGPEVASLPTPATKPAVEPPEPAPLPTQRLGTYVSEKQVLLQKEFGDGGWTRRPPQADLNSGPALLALPSFQPILSLNVGIAVQMLGGSEVTLLPTDSREAPGVDVAFGRLFIRAVGDAKAGLRFRLGDRMGMIRFQSPDAFVAVEASRLRTPGADPETEPGSIHGVIYAASGSFEWTGAGGQPAVTVTSPAIFKVEDQSAPKTVASNDLPKWVLNDDISMLDRRAAPTIEAALQVNRPVVLGLRELADHRQREVGWLAVRCLSYVGDFDSLVATLNNSELKTVPDESIAQLQAAIDRGPATAALVRKAFEKQYGQDGHALYRILWGYSDKQIDGGQGEMLVSYLESDVLAFRVLGFSALEKLTGVKFSYRPYDPASKRQTAVARWKDRLQSGLLGPRNGDSGDKKTPPAKTSGSLF